MPSIADLILEAIAAGYDVTIKTRQRDDGKEGSLTVPAGWARRAGVPEETIERSRASAIAKSIARWPRDE